MFREDLKSMIREGRVILITGTMGSGKTSLGVLIAEAWRDLRIGNTVSNLLLYDREGDEWHDPKDIEIVFTQEDFIKWAGKQKPYVQNLLIFDEAGMFAGGNETAELKNFKNFVFVVRKFHACMLLLVQSPMSVSRVIRSGLLFAHIHKWEPESAEVQRAGGELVLWRDIPKPQKLAFKTYEFAHWDNNVNMTRFVQKIAPLRYEDARSRYSEMLEGCVMKRDEHGGRKRISKREQRWEDATAIIQNGGSWEDLSTKFNMRDGTAMEWEERIKRGMDGMDD